MTTSPEPRAPECTLSNEPGYFWWKHECRVRWVGTEVDEELWIEDLLPYGPGKWQIVQESPLTISPSIWCKRCDTHGFFENGSWRSV